MGERLKLNNVTGSVTSFDTDWAQPLDSLKVSIEPVQSGSGDPSPTNIRPISGWTGCNIYRANNNLFDKNNIRYGVWTNSSGVESAAVYGCITFPIPIIETEYTVSILGTMPFSYALLEYDSDMSFVARTYTGTDNHITKSLNSGTRYVSVQVAKGNGSSAVINLTFIEECKVMLTAGASIPSKYQEGPVTYPITFPSAAGTVYGGTLDVTKGTLTVDRTMVDLGEINWNVAGSQNGYAQSAAVPNMRGTESAATVANIVCNKYKPDSQNHVYQRTTDKTIAITATSTNNNIRLYDTDLAGMDAAQYKAAVAGTFLVYYIISPVTYQLTPTEITALLGTNTIYADCGSVDASYFTRDYVPVASDTGLITITDGVEAPIDSLKVYFEPVQEGTGDPSPDNVRAITGWTGVDVIQAGKNFIKMGVPVVPPDNTTSTTDTKRRFTPGTCVPHLANTNSYSGTSARGGITSNADSIVVVSSAGYGAGFALCLTEGETYTLTYVSSLKSYRAYAVSYAYDGTYLGYQIMTTNGEGRFTVPNNCYITVILFMVPYNSEDVGKECTITNIQLEHGSTATAYEPYVGTTYPITFPTEAGTVYGGYVDVVKGELVVDRAMVDLGDWTWTKGSRNNSDTGYIYNHRETNYVSGYLLSNDHKPYTGTMVWGALELNEILMAAGYFVVVVDVETAADAKAALAGSKVVYKISQPQTYTLTPTQLSTFKGINNIYSNANGAAEMMYYSPVKESILDVRRGVIMGAPHSESISGGVASFNTNMVANLKNLTVGIEPVQAGSGDPSPDNVRAISGWTGCNITKCGKNLFDQSLMVDQVAWNTIKIYAQPGTVLTMSTNMPSELGLLVYFRRIDESQGSSTQVYQGKPVTRTVSEEGYMMLHQRRASGDDSFANYHYQIEVGSTATAFEPYNSSTISIDWTNEAGTVYGGTLDVTTGVLTVDRYGLTCDNATRISYGVSSDINRAFLVLPYTANGTGLSTKTLCTMYPAVTTVGTNKTLRMYASEADIFDNDMDITSLETVKTYLHDLLIVYPLATPQTYQLTPTQVKTLLGNNTIYADTGDVELTYWKH